MGNDKPTPGVIDAGGNVVKLDAGSVSVGGNMNITLGGTTPARPAIISTVPTPSPTFIPRKNITAKIHAALSAKPDEVVIRQAVTRAMGGYGKTVAAILYAHQYNSHYPGGRFFLPMEFGDLLTGLASLVEPLGLTSKNDPAADAAEVSRVLNSGEPSLLILDNIASKAKWDAMLTGGLVPRGACRVLLTTRDDEIATADAIQIGRLTNDEARAVFAAFCTERQSKEKDAAMRAALPAALPEDAVADAINDWLGGLAVAVAAVAAYMNLKPHIAWKDYWEGDGKNLRGLRNTPVAELPDVKPGVAEQLGLNKETLPAHRRTLRVIDDAFAALPPAEKRAVEYAAILPHDLAPARWLETLLEADAARTATSDDGTPDPLHIPLPADPDDPLSPAQLVLHHLDRLDILLPGGEAGKLLSLHRLWHARVNERAEAGGEGAAERKAQHTALLRTIAACAAARQATIIGTNPDGSDREMNDPAALTDRSLRWELTPLAETCKALWKAGHPGLAVQVGGWLATVLRLLGRYQEGAACLQVTANNEDMIAAAIGDPDLAICYASLAMIQKDQGNLPAGRASIVRAIAIDSKHFPPDHLTFAYRYSFLAAIKQAEGDLTGAKTNIESAIAIESKHLAPDDRRFAISYSNLALIQKDLGERYNSQREFAKAKSELAAARTSIDRAITVQSMYFSSDHPSVASNYNNLALIQQAQGELPGARASMERAIAIWSKHFAPDHPNFATSYNNLAHICKGEGDRAAACANFKKALGILLKHFDENHPTVKTVRKWMQIVGCGQ